METQEVKHYQFERAASIRPGPESEGGEMTLLEEVRLRLHTKMTISLKDAELAATIAMEAVAKRFEEKNIIIINGYTLPAHKHIHASNRCFLGLAAEEPHEAGTGVGTGAEDCPEGGIAPKQTEHYRGESMLQAAAKRLEGLSPLITPVLAETLARVVLEAVAKRLGSRLIIIPAHYGYKPDDVRTSNRGWLGLEAEEKKP